ncbi:MAG: amidohydrolase family protein [Acidobacteriia bacterium]|nr:amidohydrolase family protein [Terriglobia bacterium]
MIDVNVNLSRWPFRRLVGDEPAGLVAQLRKRNVTQAWAGTFDGILHKDLSSANERLVNDCRRDGPGMLVPFGSINPKLPEWQRDLRRCHEEYKMPGIRLHPNYHGYDLTDPAFSELLHLAAASRLVVQLAVCMEDQRTQHPLMRVAPVDLSPLPELLKNEPGLRLVVLNSDPLQDVELLQKLTSSGHVSFDISMVEGVGGVARLARKISIQRVLFGSHYPLFYFESALLKVRESEFTDTERRAVLEENARRLLEV